MDVLELLAIDVACFGWRRSWQGSCCILKVAGTVRLLMRGSAFGARCVRFESAAGQCRAGVIGAAGNELNTVLLLIETTLQEFALGG